MAPYQLQEQTLAQNAATSLGSLESGAATNLGSEETTAGSNLGNLELGGALDLGNLETGAAGTLGNEFLTGQGLQTTAANDLGTQYGNDVSQMIQGLALEPQEITSLFTPASNEYTAGSTEQSLDQNTINDAIQRFNYGQTLPYTTLNEFLSEINGNYGGTTTTTSPYFENSTANLLGGGLGGAALGSSLLGPNGLNLVSSGVGSAVGGGLGLLSLLKL